MNTKKIKKIVENFLNDWCTEHQEIIEPWHQVVEDLTNAIVKDYCIVSKAKARELCRLILEHGNSDDFGLIDGLIDIVSDMFKDEYYQEAEKMSDTKHH